MGLFCIAQTAPQPAEVMLCAASWAKPALQTLGRIGFFVLAFSTRGLFFDRMGISAHGAMSMPHVHVRRLFFIRFKQLWPFSPF